MAATTKHALVFLLFSFFSLSFAENVDLRVEGVTTVAQTDSDFICATLDWWPSTKCDYDQCPWGQAGLFNLDLTNKILGNALRAFSSMRLRLGGSTQDQIIYEVGKSFKSCPHMKKNDSGLFGFSHGCLHMNRWDELNAFFQQTGSRVTFGLNALYGKKPTGQDILWGGAWNSQNSRDFIQYSATKGYKIDSYELGNELCGTGVSARLDSEDYGRDILVLKDMLEQIYPVKGDRPQVLGPASFFDKEWYADFLRFVGADAVDGITHHIYNLGAGVDPDLINKVQDPYFLDEIAQTFKDADNVVKGISQSPNKGAWVGESGGAYNSGGRNVSHTFADGFWYLDQLGMSATFNHKVYCRQALIGGNYALLNTTTFVPNPDYYGALLWHRLMGTRVLGASHNGSPYLRTYAHCAKNKKGVAVLIINMSNSTTYDVSVANDMNLYPGLGVRGGDVGSEMREEYHLTPQDGDIQSDVVLLNGTPLVLTDDSDIPDMEPVLVDPTSSITVAPDSFVYATLAGFRAPACA